MKTDERAILAAAIAAVDSSFTDTAREQIIVAVAAYRAARPLSRTDNAVYMRDWRKRRAGSLTADDPRHGSVTAYTNYGCRCDACRRARRHASYRTRRTVA